MKEFISRSPSETKRIGADFAKRIVGVAPRVIALIGDLGSGKTTFVQGMARGLGIDPSYYVNSPTFTMVNEYKNLIHVDLYRIEKEEEAISLALEDYRSGGKIMVIEWAEKISLPFDIRIWFESLGREERKIRIEDS